MENVKLSLVIPCYNEESTLESIVDEVLKIQEEGRIKRREAEVELGRIESELKAKLLDIKS